MSSCVPLVDRLLVSDLQVTSVQFSNEFKQMIIVIKTNEFNKVQDHGKTN